VEKRRSGEKEKRRLGERVNGIDVFNQKTELLNRL